MKQFSILFISILSIFFFIRCDSKPQKNNESKEQNSITISTPILNPFLATDYFSISNSNPAQTNIFPYTIPQGTFKKNISEQIGVTAGIINKIAIAGTDINYWWSPSSDRMSYILSSNNNWKNGAAQFTYPGITEISSKSHRNIINSSYSSLDALEKSISEEYGNNQSLFFTSGTLAICDKNNNVYVNSGLDILMFGLNNSADVTKGFKSHTSFPLLAFTDGRATKIVGLGITYDGFIVFCTESYIGVIDRKFSQKPQIFNFNDNETCSNSFCIDENNGIYVVTDKYMRKLVWNGEELSNNEQEGAWTAEYNHNNRGSGSTPMLVGFGENEDQLVVITDGEDHMNLVAFWRNNIPNDFTQKPNTKSKQIADQIPVSCGYNTKPEFIQNYKPLASYNNGVFVCNTGIAPESKEALSYALALGHIIEAPKGFEKFEWNSKLRKWKSVFANSEITTLTATPAISTASNMVFCNSYSKKNGWEIIGIDWNTGKIAHTTLLGKSIIGNAAYGSIQSTQNNSLILNTLSGSFRITY